MTAYDIAQRVAGRPMARGWIGRCPAHDDRSPSLAIAEGRDGRILLRCHAGCETRAIAQALGLKVQDLFANDRPSDAYRRQAPRRVSADDVERELQLERRRILASDSERCGFDVAELVRHRNEARAVIERRFGVSLKREQPQWSELEPHCIDPAWSGCVDAALVVVAARANMGADELGGEIHALPATQHRILGLARRFQRELAQPSVQSEAA